MPEELAQRGTGQVTLSYKDMFFNISDSGSDAYLLLFFHFKEMTF